MYDKLSQLHSSGSRLRRACGEVKLAGLGGFVARKTGMGVLNTAGWAAQHPFLAATAVAGGAQAKSSVGRGIQAGRATRTTQAIKKPTFAV